MKLKLKNFRCYLEREFDFGMEGLVLLCGASGSGKSSILMAITFALYGTGQKITMMGKTSCQVDMEFGDLRIVRTKKPNRLVVTNIITNEEYEDDAGQGIINERFGTSFDITSYIQQNAINSFIMMSPTDKLAFLEKFAFTGVDLGQIKVRCQSLIKNRNEELLMTTSQLEMANKYFGSLKKPDKIQFPIPMSKKGRDHAIKNELTRHKNSKILIKHADRDIELLKKELNDLRVFIGKNGLRKENISSLQEKIETIILESKATHYEGDEQLQDYEDRLNALISRREVLVLKERYEQDKGRLKLMHESEREEIQKKVEEIETHLWKDYSENEVSNLISERIDMLKDAEQLERLQKSIEKYEGVNEQKLDENKKKLEESRKIISEKKEKLSKLILQKELYECPSCHTSLRFQDDELYVYDESPNQPDDDVDINDVENEISTLTKTINKLEYYIPEEQSKLKRYNEIKIEMDSVYAKRDTELLSKDEAETDIEHLKEYKHSQNEQERMKKKLETDIKDKRFSNTVEMFKSQISKQKETIKLLESKLKLQRCDETVDEEELSQTIQIQRQNKDRVNGYQKQLKSLNKELKINTDELEILKQDHTSKYKIIKDCTLLETDIKVRETKLVDLKNDSMKHDDIIAKIGEYQKYKEELGRYSEWETKILELSEQEQKQRQKYSASMLLKEKILEAESIAVANIIGSINTHAQEYLDLFFSVDPIVIRLLPFKQSKKKTVSGTTKPQINLEIDYKGMEADLNMLSGGELARVILAYCLSLAEIFNSPFILLDECTASLDQDLNSAVLEGIQKNFGGKLVIVIAHQVVSGDFDRQICL